MLILFAAGRAFAAAVSNSAGPDSASPASSGKGNAGVVTKQAARSGGRIIYPWNAATAIVKAGDDFTVWFVADAAQKVTSAQLRGPYNSVSIPSVEIQTGSWVYDKISGNTYNTRVTVPVPANAPADRYDLMLNTSAGQVISRSAVKVIAEYKKKYKVFHISDSHIGQQVIADGLIEAKHTAFVDMANIINPEMVFVTGDNISWNHHEPSFQKRVDLFYQGDDTAGWKGMHDFHAACFVAGGNHDYEEQKGGQPTNCCYDLKADFWNRYHGLQYHAFKYGKTRCLVINNGWAGYDFSYQLTDLADWLKGDGAGGNLKLAAYHVSNSGLMGAFAEKVDLGLAIIGHNHHLGSKNPYLLGSRLIQYYALSTREYCEFNLYQIDDEAGSCEALGYVNTDPLSDGYGRPTGICRVLENNDEKNNPDTSVWIYNLTLNYAHANDGAASNNTATLVNRFDFAIPDARVRFVVPKGAVYNVSAGSVQQQFDGDRFRIVDVSIDLRANSTTTVNIAPSAVSAAGDSPHQEGHLDNDGDSLYRLGIRTYSWDDSHWNISSQTPGS